LFDFVAKILDYTPAQKCTLPVLNLL